MSHTRPQPGFTLIELMVALVIAGLALASAGAVLLHLAAVAEHIVEAAADAEREANADRLLRDLVGRVDVDTGSGDRFIGGTSIVHFPSWCDVPAGWQERCDVGLGLLPDGHRYTLAILLSTREPIPIRSGVSSGRILYLDSRGAGDSWLPFWGEVGSTPRALGVVVDGDTLILRIGERG